MKRHFILFHFILSTGFGSWSAQAQGQSDHFVLPPGKAIYQPKEFAGQDWYSDTSRYSYRRMSCTDNLAIFWEKGFGNDLAAPPDLEGHPMAVDLENLKYQLERFYLFYRDSLKFVKPGSQSEKYRMMAMIQYSLEGLWRRLRPGDRCFLGYSEPATGQKIKCCGSRTGTQFSITVDRRRRRCRLGR